MVKILDYGGNKIRRSHNRKNYGDLHGTISMRCLDCDKLRYVLPRELSRAKMPRCLGCGGALEETDVARKRRGFVAKSKISKVGKSITAPLAEARKERCKSCGHKMEFFATTRGYLHLLGHHDCRRYYIEEGHFIEWCGDRFLEGTDYLEKFGSKWLLVCLNSQGKQVIVKSFQRRMDAEEYQLNLFGPPSEELEELCNSTESTQDCCPHRS